MNGKGTVIAIQSGIPVLLWGGPGIGKTSFVQELGRLSERNVQTVIASIREPSDFAGLPVITQTDSVKMAPPQWAISLVESNGGILFLDELTTAPPAVQAALLRVVLERQVGELKLPDDTWIIAAANPVETSSGTWLLSAALSNRMLHITWNLSQQKWIAGMIDGFNMEREMVLLPEDWRDGVRESRNMVASFIQHKPTLLYNPPEDAETSGKAWPSPRSWDMAATVMAAATSVGLSKDDEHTLMEAAVGQGAAIEFLTWVRSLDLVHPKEALANPDKVALPKRGDQIFAMLTSIVSYAKENMNLQIWLASWTIMGRAAEGGYADLAALPARMLAEARTKDLPIPTSVKHFAKVLDAAGLLK